jgi:RIP homotypic interaction motif
LAHEIRTVTANGIDRIEGDSSAFTRKDPFAGINITANGSNTIQVGNGNYVNARYADLHGELENLGEDIRVSRDLDEQTKFGAITDIETVKLQLAKPEPDRSVLASVWPKIQKVATLAGLAASAAAIATRIHGLI